MKLDKNMKLANLMYGHGSKFICFLSGRFNPEKYSDAPPIQICEMKCGCWIVADGNNRVGLILKKNPEPTIAEIPERLLATARFGEWDAEMVDWWNPCAKSFREVMGKRGKKIPALKDSIYGIIERDGEGKFIASTHGLKKRAVASATGCTPDEAKRLLEDNLKIMLKPERASLVLTPLNPMEDHQCSLLWTESLTRYKRLPSPSPGRSGRETVQPRPRSRRSRNSCTNLSGQVGGCAE
jgi:hypothetical protein